MKPINSYLKINIIGQIILILFLLTFLLNETYAKAGCCANHGGVAGCNASTGYQKCNDGTTSPSCECKAKTYRSSKSAKSATITPEAASTSTSNSTQAQKKQASSKKSRCCARHGGVAQCNKVTGYLQCKDKTTSPTCKC